MLRKTTAVPGWAKWCGYGVLLLMPGSLVVLPLLMIRRLRMARSVRLS